MSQSRPETQANQLAPPAKGSPKKPFSTKDTIVNCFLARVNLEKLPDDKKAKQICLREIIADSERAKNKIEISETSSPLFNVRATISNNLSLLNVLSTDPNTPRNIKESLRDPAMVKFHQDIEQTFNSLSTKIDNSVEKRNYLKTQYKGIIGSLYQHLDKILRGIKEGKSAENLRDEINDIEATWKEAGKINTEADLYFKEQKTLGKNLVNLHEKLLVETSRFEQLKGIMETLPQETISPGRLGGGG